MRDPSRTTPPVFGVDGANRNLTGNYRLDQPLDVLRSLAHITSAKLSEYPALVILN